MRKPTLTELRTRKPSKRSRTTSRSCDGGRRALLCHSYLVGGNEIERGKVQCRRRSAIRNERKYSHDHQGHVFQKSFAEKTSRLRDSARNCARLINAFAAKEMSCARQLPFYSRSFRLVDIRRRAQIPSSVRLISARRADARVRLIYSRCGESVTS